MFFFVFLEGSSLVLGVRSRWLIFFGATAGLTLASFVLGLAVLRELTLPPFQCLSASLREEVGVAGEGGGETFSVSVFSSALRFERFLLFFFFFFNTC